MNIKFYSVHGEGFTFESQVATGKWAKREDVEKLVEENKALREQNKKLTEYIDELEKGDWK